MSGGFTNKANAEYRGLQEHMIRDHGFTPAQVSGKSFAELELLHDNRVIANGGKG